jgi:geranylgeranyl diphosphate synthase type I
VAESTRLVDLVQSRIDEFLGVREPIVTGISPDLTAMVDFSRQFLRGGKRFRALFCYWGSRSVVEGPERPDGHALALSPAVIAAASALEIFHAAALVHDDIIDGSDTRRGAASAHKLFEGMHLANRFAGSAEAYGQAAAILLGDLMLGWSDELLDEGLDEVADRPAARRARAEFNRMRTEVTAGQYLDILEERAWLRQPDAEHHDRALRVVVYKSAKYSVQAPLTIGAALAGGTPEQLDGLRSFGLPLGIAFQLRDDLLGVFGDAEVTGKPSGDDLREGKRTVLVALARDAVSGAPLRRLDDLLGNPDLDAGQIALLQDTIQSSGAVDRIEELIDRYVGEAVGVLAEAPINSQAKAHLRELTRTVTRRAF